jgi:Phycobilisome protein
MLFPAYIADTPTTQRFVSLWAKRYIPRLPVGISAHNPQFYHQLEQAASPEGRAQTAARLQLPLVVLSCEFASIQAQALHEYIPNILDLSEAKKISQLSTRVYLCLLESYQQFAPNETLTAGNKAAFSQTEKLPAWGIPNIVKLAYSLETILLEYQDQCIAAKDWCTPGFLTTHFNFCNQVLLDKLTFAEQVIAEPYFKFVEEQIALPWQRVCAAAAQHEASSPVVEMVAEMLPLANEIAQAVYAQLLEKFPRHRGRRGRLNHPGVKHSCLRDLNMFQAYLWLCVLQGDMAPVTNELVMLCIMVMQRVGVPWERMVQWTECLMDEVVQQVAENHRSLVLPYTEGLKTAFFESPHNWQLYTSSSVL